MTSTSKWLLSSCGHVLCLRCFGGGQKCGVCGQGPVAGMEIGPKMGPEFKRFFAPSFSEQMGHLAQCWAFQCGQFRMRLKGQNARLQQMRRKIDFLRNSLKVKERELMQKERELDHLKRRLRRYNNNNNSSNNNNSFPVMAKSNKAPSMSGYFGEGQVQRPAKVTLLNTKTPAAFNSSFFKTNF